MATEPAPATAADRTRLGAFDIGCVVVGGIIGVGIFFTPSKVAAAVDDSWQVVLAWGIGGLVAALGALVFAELSRLQPGHGGTFVYIARGVGRVPAFLYGWANWLVIQAGALGVIALFLLDQVAVLLTGHEIESEPLQVLLAVATIAVFTVLNMAGLHVGRRVQNLFTVAKTLAVFGLVLLALPAAGAEPGDVVDPVERLAGEPRGWLVALAAAMLPVLFSFGGWQQGSFLAGAARSPERDVPLGIVGGVVVVVTAYISVNLAFLGLLGFEGTAQAGSTVATDAAEIGLEPFGLGDAAQRILAGAIVVSSLGILNTCLMAPPFVLHAMARQGLFFAAVGRLHPDHGNPTLGVLVQGGWAMVLLLGAWLATGTPGAAIDFLLQGVVFVDWLFFFLCGLALLRIRTRLAPDAWRARGGSIVAVLFGLASLAITAGAVWTAALPSAVGLGIVLLGLPALWLGRHRFAAAPGAP